MFYFRKFQFYSDRVDLNHLKVKTIVYFICSYFIEIGYVWEGWVSQLLQDPIDNSSKDKICFVELRRFFYFIGFEGFP